MVHVRPCERLFFLFFFSFKGRGRRSCSKLKIEQLRHSFHVGWSVGKHRNVPAGTEPATCSPNVRYYTCSQQGARGPGPRAGWGMVFAKLTLSEATTA